MSWQATKWVLEHARPLTPAGQPDYAAQCVLHGLAFHADEDGENSFPSVPTLMRYANLKERTTREKLALLQRAGWIREVGRRRLAGMSGVDLPCFELAMGRTQHDPNPAPRRRIAKETTTERKTPSTLRPSATNPAPGRTQTVKNNPSNNDKGYSAAEGQTSAGTDQSPDISLDDVVEREPNGSLVAVAHLDHNYVGNEKVYDDETTRRAQARYAELVANRERERAGE